MKTVEIRKKFLQYFEEHGHKIIDSAPLVPINDPSLLWINAGVVAMKKYFDGSEIPQNLRMVNSQRCIRTNDIDSVGYTSRHHTYFEMLGNFSIGDYFKKMGIFYAFDFLTSAKWLGIDVKKLYMTYYPSDFETRDIWISLGIEKNRLIPLEGNFWEIGEGPCGPCTEIFYDRGECYDLRGEELLINDVENERYIELWNVVLSQFNSKDGVKREDYEELPSKNIDTGMGLERVACIMQNVKTNFDTDIFEGIMNKISELSNVTYNGQTEFKIIADHVRTLTLAINDSVIISNEGRGYVLRRILRRAVRYGFNLGFEEPFMYKLVRSVANSLPFYKLDKSANIIEKIIKNEEEKFFKTLALGEKKINSFLSKGSLSGKEAFLMYDTFGFPIELTKEIAHNLNVSVDVEEFNNLLIKQKERSRDARNEDHGLMIQNETLLDLDVDSKFIGYDTLANKTKIVAIIQDDELKSSAIGEMMVVLEQTPFYAKSGGQESDCGYINGNEVLDVIKAPHNQHLHIINSSSQVLLESCECIVDEKYRKDVTRNHSATHLLNYALKSYFGDHVKQQGSYVCNKYLRFDFTHYGDVFDKDIIEIEKLVNNYILEWENISIEEMGIDEAKSLGAVALFGEKYGNVVRVVKLGKSIELCGGCHVNELSCIDKFAIVNFESKGSGVYRITAATSDYIAKILQDSLEEQFKAIDNLIDKIQDSCSDAELKVNGIYDDITDINEIKNNLVKYDNKLTIYKYKNKLSKARKAIDKKRNNDANVDLNIEKYINDKKAIITIENTNVDAVKTFIDNSFEKYKLEVIFVVIKNDSAIFIAKASENAIKTGINCGELVKTAAKICGGNGGGKSTFAQAGAKNLNLVDKAIEKVKEMI
ncbi:MAG: alanine--tRNA ligase [Bacilli bacterium]